MQLASKPLFCGTESNENPLQQIKDVTQSITLVPSHSNILKPYSTSFIKISKEQFAPGMQVFSDVYKIVFQ